eukprot:SAG25_NODE_11955_length_291_cov_0.807292_1_plen_68_part_10
MAVSALRRIFDSLPQDEAGKVENADLCRGLRRYDGHLETVLQQFPDKARLSFKLFASVRVHLRGTQPH